MTAPASLARLESYLRETFTSKRGADGMDALVARAKAFASLHALDATAPVDRVKAFIEACDAPDVRHRKRPLRAGDPLSGSQANSLHQDNFSIDELIRCGFVQAFAVAAIEEVDARSDVIRAWSEQDQYWPPTLLQTARHELDLGRVDEAIALTKRALAIKSADPEAQAVLYDAYLAKRNAGGPPGTEISLADLSDRFCSAPFETVETLSASTLAKGGAVPGVFACPCGGWLPYETSGRDPNATAEDIWNGETVQELRRSILDGDYSYCSRTLCPLIVGDLLPRKRDVVDPVWRDVIDNHKLVLETGPRYVQLSHDPSCNLACPSCRSDLILAKQRERSQYDAFVERVVKPLMRRTEGLVTITGYGDPLGSKHYRELIKSLCHEEYPGIELELVTNAQLLTERQWNDLGAARELVKTVSVSIDAAREATYHDVRRPGKWDILLANMAFISELRRQRKLTHLQVNFVVQQKNFREMPDFIKLGLGWNVDTICFQKLWNFGPYTGEQFLAADISDPCHPEHGALIKVLGNPLLKERRVSLFNLAGFETQSWQEGRHQSIAQEQGGQKSVARRLSLWVSRFLSA